MHCCLWPLTFFTSLFSFFHLAHRSYKYFDVNIDVYIMDTNVCVHSYLEVGFDLISALISTPLPSNRHHLRSGDCLEGKGENYQVCSVQYCVQQLCTVQCTHI